MIWTYNTLVVMAGAALLGLLCGLVGTFAVLRRRALLGDVLAHATLPGLGLAFLLFQARSLPVLLTGALVSGLIGIWALSYLRRHTRTKDDAAMGLILAVFFGAGISISRHIQNTVRDGSHAGLDSFIFGKTAGMVMADVLLTIVVCAVAIVVIGLFFKEFQLVCFDTGFAQSLGWPVLVIDFTILGLLTLAVVVGLPMVGVVMVAALTIIPPVAARLWVRSLKAMLVLSSGFGIVSTVGGVLLSATWEGLPTGPMIVLTAAAIFILSALFAPRQGIVATYHRLRSEKLLHGQGTLLRELAVAPLGSSEALQRLQEVGVTRPRSVIGSSLRAGLVTSNGVLELTSAGAERLASWRMEIVRNSGASHEFEPTTEDTGKVVQA